MVIKGSSIGGTGERGKGIAERSTAAKTRNDEYRTVFPTPRYCDRAEMRNVLRGSAVNAPNPLVGRRQFTEAHYEDNSQIYRRRGSNRRFGSGGGNAEPGARWP